MDKNFVQEGKALNYTAGADIPAISAGRTPITLAP